MLRLLALSALIAAVAAIPKSYTPSARDVSSSCPSAVVTSSRSAQVGNNTVLLEVLTCAGGTTAPIGLVAHTSVGQTFENLLCQLIPIFCPPKAFAPPAPPAKPSTTVTVVQTATVVRTATLVQTATEVVPTTVIDATTLVVPTTIIAPTTVIDATTLVVPTTVIAPTTVIDETTLAVQVPTTIISPTTIIVTTAAPTSSAVAAATNVCGEICTTTCSELGALPPDSNDCQVVKESIQVFQSTLSPTFTVAPNHVQQLTFGTCRFFFENLGLTPLEACWSDLSQEGSLAATTCFPPASQPVLMSLAVCEARDTTWEIGVSHS